MDRLRIVVADDEPLMLQYYQATMPKLGHEVAAAVRDGAQLIEACREARPDMIVTDIKMPGVDGIDAATAACAERPLPVILVSAFHDEDLLQRASGDHVLAYLVKPIKQADLEAAIMVAMRRFREFQDLQRETADLRQALEDRKIIERAKGILMKRAQMDEAAAFRRLQKLARDKNQKLVEIAHSLVTADEALGG